jgi:nitrate reductase gamma subunit
MSGRDVLLWVVIPYLCIASFVGGHIWRYRYDKFGWTTRSSQMYERRMLRWASPLFHFGILVAIGGHVIGVLIPKPWTEALGIGETAYHAVAVTLGTVAGVATVAGLALLIYRRRTVGPVFSATTRNDKFMYVFLAATIVLGLGTTVLGNLTGHPHDYRETVAPYFRSIFYFQPKPELLDDAPFGFQLHVMAAWLLFAVWPFTRLVHVFSAPVGYLTRPYIVYRSRDLSADGSRRPRRGWEPVSRPGAGASNRR